MSVWLVLALLVVAVIAAVALSPRLRKSVLIGATYVSLTGWYYYRKWEKQRNGGEHSPTGAPTRSSRRNKAVGSDEDVRYFESPEQIEQRLEKKRAEQEQQERLRQERQTSFVASEASYRGSNSSSYSAYSDDLMESKHAPKSHLGIFRGLSRSHRAGKQRSSSEAGMTSAQDTYQPAERFSSVASVPLSPSSSMATRRTYRGRKKPASWAD